MKKSVLLILLVLLVPLGVLAQEITGTIVGNVKDATGAVIPSAKVAVINTDNGVVRTVVTNASGDFIATLLPIGHYKVEVTADKFRKSVLSAIELNVSDRYVANFTLQIGSTTEEVVVEANPVQVELASATATGLLSGTEVRELSLNNRNYEQMVALMPGVSYGGGDQLYIGTTNPSGQANTVSFSINGSRNSANNWTVDGADNVDRGSNLTLINYPSVDAIAEFKVLRGLYSAEYGRGAGQVNVITRSGDNRLHGSAYEFARNDAFSANDYFRKRNPNPTINSNPAPLRYNDFGFTVGGPVVVPGVYNGKNKTFFFVSQEYRRVITYSTNPTTMPTADEKLGIMPSDTCIAWTTAARGTCSTWLPKGTALTSVRPIDPVAAAYIKDIWANAPNPDNPVTNEYQVSGRNVFNNRQDMVRLDHVFNSKVSVFGRYINDTIPTEEPFGLFGPKSLIPGVATSKTKSPGRTWVGRVTSTLTPNLLLEGGYNYSRSGILSDDTGTANLANAPNIASAIKGILPYTPTLARIPAITGAFAAINGYGPYKQYNRDHNVFGNIAWTHGAHAFKFGATWHNYSKTENAGDNNTGTFGFDATGFDNKNPRPNNLGQTDANLRNAQSWMNFLTGSVASFTQISQDLTAYIRMRQFEAYAQDEWKLSNRLSLSYGVRYSYFPQPFNDNAQVLSNFDPRTYDPAKAVAIDPATGLIKVDAAGNPTQGSLYNGMIYASGPMKNSPYGDKVGKGTKGNWAPRIGVAFDPFGNGKTSIRTGYGMFVQSTLVGTYEQAMFLNPPYAVNLSIPTTTLGNPAGAVPSISAVPKVIRGVQTTGDMPYSQQWSIDVQQQLAGDLLVDVGYYGSKETHLLGMVDINQPKPGDYITAGISTAPLTSTNVVRINAIRPYKGFGAINVIRPWFGANYNSLQASVEKRFKNKSMIKGNYTWSHGLTDSWSDRSNAPANTYDIHQNYGPSALDRRHIFTGTYIYELPFFRQQKGWVANILGGWQTSGIVSIAAGLPLNVSGNLSGSSSVDAAGQGCISTSLCPIRPNMIGDPNNGGAETVSQWFNTKAFAANTTPGSVSSSPSGAILGPGYVKIDMSLFKTFKLTEAANLQFRFETFNVANHENFNTINTSFGNALFGQVTGSRDPRLIQLGAKLQF